MTDGHSRAAWTLAPGEEGWPAGLGDLPDEPAFLSGVGRREVVAGLDPDGAVTIVGSRRATAYGRQVAELLAHDLATAGLVVVSGMAHGIDSAAHRGALAARGLTVAVLAGGADMAYPPSQRRLYERVVASGAAVSERAPGVSPERWAFIARNRIMGALSAATVVVEAAERSGTRHTSDAAIGLGRMVGAVPGPVTSRVSAGPHALLREGAHPVCDAQDVLDLMLGVGATRTRRAGPALEPGLGLALEAIEGGAATLDAVVGATGLDPAEAAVACARLELMGYLQGEPGGALVRTALVAP